MEPSEFAERALFANTPEEKLRCPGLCAGERPGLPLPTVFWFNPLAEGRIAQGKTFTPVKYQAALARDLASLPQFLGRPGDIVLVEQQPGVQFLGSLKQAGFALADFIELARPPQPPTTPLSRRRLGALRPWAWGPDSLELFDPLFGQLPHPHPSPAQCFNPGIARLYSKAWSAGLLRKLLASHPPEPWLCTADEIGVPVNTLDDALRAIATIRARGHHRIIVKEAVGLAGHNAIRLWEPELLDTQRRWLANVLENGRELVIEPWLEREADFSMQVEMGASGLKLRGYTGLLNDRKGQFLGNSAAADFERRIPLAVTRLFDAPADISERLQQLFASLQALLETELRQANYTGPAGIDAFVYRSPKGGCRLKPVVELNPRYTMGRLTVELMRQVAPGSHGLFRLVTLAQARADDADGFNAYARTLSERFPLCMEVAPAQKIREGALCLTDPARAQVCLATFRVSRD
jgi:hypothetical protein